MERERTPEQIVELGIHLHLAGVSLSNTKQYLERLGVERSRTAIHKWFTEGRFTAGWRRISESDRGRFSISREIFSDKNNFTKIEFGSAFSTFLFCIVDIQNMRVAVDVLIPAVRTFFKFWNSHHTAKL